MNITAKYLKVWKKESNDYGVTLNLGERKKKYNADGYDSWTWFKCKVKGNASNVNVNEGDTIHINSGLIQQFKTNEGKYLNDVVIFEMEVVPQEGNGYGGNQKPANNSYNKPSQGGNGNFEDDIPF